MSDDEKEESSRLTVRGLPEHQKDTVRREQNRKVYVYIRNATFQAASNLYTYMPKQCAQRFREKRREEYRQLCAAVIASANQVNKLEKRIKDLVKVLEDAGIEVPPNTCNLVQENIEDNDAANNQKIFDEMMQVIEQVDDDNNNDATEDE